jgi:hypothetical protein
VCFTASLMASSISALVPVAATLLQPVPAMAQAVNARIEGTITDPTGAVIPNAHVTIRNVDTNVVAFDGKTDAAGVYHALTVPPGKYTVTAEANGFRKQEQENVNVSLAQNITLDFAMMQGSVDQVLTVTSNAQAVLNQSDATISTLVTPSAIQDLPLQNRNITQVFLLTPGVAQGGNTNSQNNAQLVFNGGRVLGTNPLLDGTSVINASTGQIDQLPSPDALSEVKVITTSPSAEYGRSSGATVLFTTKSGTNQFHGGLYTLLRNEALDANTWVNKQTGTARPKDRFLQYGGTFGGPILLPHLYNGRNRTFFFFNYDVTRTKSPASSTQTIPGIGSNPNVTCGAGSGFRGGDFAAAAGLVTIIDPKTGQPFPNNIIPCGRINPAAAKIMALLPAPNQGGSQDKTNARFTNNYFQQDILSSVTPLYTGRFDENIGTRLTLFGSVNYWTPNSPSQIVFNPTLNNNKPAAPTSGWEAAIGGNEVITPTLIVQGHFGFYRTASTSESTSQGINNADALGIQSTPAAITPTFTVSGYSSLGPPINSLLNQSTQTFSEYLSVTKILGPHTIKAGEENRWNQFNRLAPTSYNNGMFNFDGTVSNSTHAGGSAVAAQADFLLGAIKNTSYELPQPEQGRRNYNLSFFAQDDWKARNNLTLNLGIRQEYESPLTVAHNIYSRFDPSTGVLLVAGKNASRSLNLPTPLWNLSPHFGFAYTPTPGTVVRGGFSIVYGQIFSNLGSQVNSPGFDVVTNTNNLGTGIPQPFTLSQGIPLTGVQNLDDPASSLGTGTTQNPIQAGGPEFISVSKLSSNQQANIGIQQDLGHSIVLEANYIHAHSIHLPVSMSLNQSKVIDEQGNINTALATQIGLTNTTTFTQSQLPFPTLTNISGQGNYGGAHYDALQVSGRRQFSSSIAFIASYTWSKSIDDSSGIYSFSQPSGINGIAPWNAALRRRYDVGLSSFDQRNAANIAVQYTSHGNVWTKDFRISAIFVAHSGIPQTITESGANVPGASSQRPNGNASLIKEKTRVHTGNAIQYFTPPGDSAFPFTVAGPFYATPTGGKRTQYAAPAFGTAGRNTTSQPGEQTLNMAASRTFSIKEGLRFQIRVDALNVLNHTNLQGANTSLTVTNVGTAAAPAAGFSSAGFGQITSAWPTRQLQLLGRFSF